MAIYKKNLVSFVVLNWNGIHDTLLCLESIRKQDYPDVEIIVIDQGSAEDQKSTLRSISDIKLVDLPKNTGFTGGQIEALKHTKGEYIALINNDSVISPDWTKIAVSSFGKVKKIAAVGGRGYLWNDDLGYKAFNNDNPFYSYQVVNLRTGHTKTNMHGDAFASVNSISGSGVMLKRSIIDLLGYFDNQFFAYYEETDLFARYKRAGYKIYYEPSMSTWHKIAQSTRSKPDFYLFHMHRNRFLFAIKNYDLKYVLSFVKTYSSEVAHALLRVAKNGRSKERESANIIRAGLWNLPRLPITLAKRHKVKKLGPTYSKLLLSDSSESITVIIPCYNYAEYVAETIESVLAQTRKPDEIIVINDGSTDDSLKHISKYSDMVTIINQKNMGIVKTKNLGYKTAKSDWVIFLDADDKIKPTYIDRLVSESRKSSADVTYSGMQFFGKEKGNFLSRPFSEYTLLKGNYINNSALIRRQLLVYSGGYKQEMSFGYEDWELYLTLAEKGARFGYVRSPLLMYRRHGQGSRDNSASLKLDKAHKLVRAMHPSMYTWKHRFFYVLESILTFHQRRTPKQYFADTQYLFVKYLEKKSTNSTVLSKLLGFYRLLKNKEYKKIVELLKLNLSNKGRSGK